MKFLLKTTLDDLLEWYKTTEVFDSVSGFAKRFRLDKVASIMSHTYLKKHGLGPDYSKEVVEVATRVNYGSNLDEIHALGALVTMAANDALQIHGGNFQIFEGMVGHSKANVQLNAKIARVRRLPPRDGEESLFEVTMASGQKEIFNAVVLAAPIVSFPLSLSLSDTVLLFKWKPNHPLSHSQSLSLTHTHSLFDD
jgi:prenylcysteine oxidase/farnesylcysteine lyase